MELLRNRNSNISQIDYLISQSLKLKLYNCIFHLTHLISTLLLPVVWNIKLHNRRSRIGERKLSNSARMQRLRQLIIKCEN